MSRHTIPYVHLPDAITNLAPDSPHVQEIAQQVQELVDDYHHLQSAIKARQETTRPASEQVAPTPPWAERGEGEET